MINRKQFYLAYKQKLIRGKLTQKKVNSINKFLDLYDKNKSRLTPLEWGYVFATVFWETSRTFDSVKESGGSNYLKKKKYYPFYGRGLVQLTWGSNYKKVGGILNVDLVKNPNKLLQDYELSFEIMLRGMKEGWFTGKSFDSYNKNDLLTYYTNCRHIINGINKDKEIAEYAMSFYEILTENHNNAVENLVIKDRKTSKTLWLSGGGIISLGISLIEEAKNFINEVQPNNLALFFGVLSLGLIIYIFIRRWNEGFVIQTK